MRRFVEFTGQNIPSRKGADKKEAFVFVGKNYGYDQVYNDFNCADSLIEMRGASEGSQFQFVAG